jgi:hypothetical protein
VPGHSLSAMCEYCIGCHVSKSVSCGNSNIAAMSWREVYLPMSQEVLEMSSIGLDIFPTPFKQTQVSIIAVILCVHVSI